MLELNPVHFSSMCRLCLKIDHSRGILETSKYLALIQDITNIKVHQNDILPRNLCKNCMEKLDDIFEFIQMCNNNNDILYAFQEKKVFKLEINDLDLKVDYDNDLESVTSLNDIVFSDISEEEGPKKIIKITCKYCNKNFSSKNKLKNHLDNICSVKNNNASSEFICLICDWICISKAALRNHEKNEHTENIEISVGLKKRKWKCSDCEKLFSKKIDLQRHRRTHTGLRPFSCNRCDKSFTQKSTLERHIGSKHFESKEERDYYECYICERKFVRKDHLEAHMYNVHIKRQSNVEPLELGDYLDLKSCRLCGKTFSIYSYLQNHLRVHEDVNKSIKLPKIRNIRFVTTSNLCSICGQSFEKRKTYQMHMNRKHSNKKYEYKSKSKLDKRDNYQCWHCGKIFTTHSNLKVHIRIHTGEKPYECKFCSQRFAAYSSWHEHENIHTGAKPFQCDFCKKGFRQRGSLRKHLRSSIHRKLVEAL